MIEVPPPYRSFASDNVAGAHPAVLEAVIAANEGSAAAYGDDPYTAECEASFEALFGRPVTVRLTFNGTGANVMAFAAMLGALRGPVHAVVCTEWSHAHMDEAGAPERILGAKLIDLPSADARLRPEHLDAVASLRSGPHHAPPGIVTIIQPTELGTLYVPDEIAALCARAHELGLLVHLDGARIANAVAALGGDASALRAQTSEAGVDVMSFGGTKNGALGAEAVFVGSGIFKSDNPPVRAKAIVEATLNYQDPSILAKVSRGLGEAMPGLEMAGLDTKLADRGW